MVVTKGDSPSRRRSIAVASHAGSGQSTAIPRRRRAYSVVPRTSLSPQAKARRLLVPRKSILKQSFTPDDTEPLPTQSTQSTQAAFDDNDVTQSMEFTQDFRARIHDNASRKSFGRRVSFAEHAHVRVFQIPDKNQVAPTSPSSPASTSSDPIEPPPVTNENDYPQAVSSRRRSSIRFSTGGDDMDMTSVMGFQPPGSAILDEEFDDDDMAFSDDMDMEVTQVVQGGLPRKRSLSMGTDRRDTLPPSAILDMSDDPVSEGEQDQTQSSVADDSIVSEAASDKSQNMEFTIPLAKSLRPPAHEDEAWLALRQATHSGDTPYEPEDESLEEDFNQPNGGDMHLDDAVQRLMRARASLSGQNGDDETGQLDNEGLEDTVSSMASMDETDADAGNRTLNISKVLGRVSMGADLSSRMSMGFGEASMDESEVYGSVAAMRRQSMAAARQSLLPSRGTSSSNPDVPPPAQPIPPPPTVFRPPPPPSVEPNPAPPSSAPSSKQAAAPSPFSFAPQPPTTPSKSKPTPTFTPLSKTPTVPAPNSKGKAKPTFTAAFAPPTTRPSPKKIPQKRPLGNENEAEILDPDADKPSPAKRQALASKWGDTAHSRPEEPSTGEATPKPRPLSPSKKSPFQSMGTRVQPRASTSSAGAVASNGIRRPTGYMARRKSLAASAEGGALATKSPRKAAGRMSLASAPQDAWTRFDKNAHAPQKKSARFQEEPEGDDERGQEFAAPEEEEPSPRSPSPVTKGPKVRLIDPETSEQVPVDLSTVNDREFGDEEQDEEMEMDDDVPAINKTAQWRDGVEDQYEEEEEIPAISISQFFSMTGIKFMDELTAPRRSIHPSQNPTRTPRDPQDIPLSDYVVAMAIDIPQLELYTRVSRDLEAWMEKSKSVFAEAEEEAEKVTPELFVEYARADEEGQAELLHQLNFIKINTRGSAKSDWYDWKLKWVEGLRMTADKAFTDLESDARKLESLSAAAAKVIPDLEREYEQIMAELEKEQAEVAEIEACDQDYLNELKASIAEQNIEVEALKAEEERPSTRAEVFQLKDELEALEELHMVRVIKVNSQMFEYNPTRTRAKDDFPRLSDLFLACATQILDDDEDVTVPKTIHKLGDYWTSCSQLRSHLRLLNIKYPIAIDIGPMPAPDSGSLPTFQVRASVMFPKVAGKAIVSYIFNLQAFSQWPLSIDSLDCAVEISYGPLDRGAILKAVIDRLAEASFSDNYLLLDSCIEAQNLYN
ncbi:Spc7 kinetochore protein-domain-containing protein [Ephemerocybe angulata]|uniref:Spc7 kinetochore protein-domain-containing protein n=1 Tax=Ephemerocybe angulata TaxID=980116 RepID=A0A8H6MHA7_9AGAR|nr:Spc7 kinetochore protein-domain-containing protein [Tulosesus angulatus]